MRQGACFPLGATILFSISNTAVAPAQPIATASTISFRVELEPEEKPTLIQGQVASLRRAPSAPVMSPSLRRLDAATPEHMTAGEWSEAVGGLRGRLLFAEDGIVGDTHIGVVYLELQNLSDVSNPLEINDGALACQLLDASDRQVEQSHTPANVMSPLPFWIVLPHDSTLRFRVSVTGYGTPKDGGLSIGLTSGHWLIPAMSRASYFLSASFSVTPPRAGDHVRPWKGVLTLPRVEVSANRMR